jgi:hypothetical protein
VATGNDGPKRNPRDRYGVEAQERAGRALAQLDRMCNYSQMANTGLQRLSVRLGVVDHIETLVVVSIMDEDGEFWVGFNSSMLPSEAIVGAINRVLNGTMKWKEDEYRQRSTESGSE